MPRASEVVTVGEMSAEEFGSKVADAVRHYEGQPFVDHDLRAGCRLGVANNLCFEVGLGQDGIDCSGLIVVSASDVLGIDYHSWPADLRHSGQMYRAVAQYRTIRPKLMPGALLFRMTSGLPSHVMVADSEASIVHATSDTWAVSRLELSDPASFNRRHQMFPVAALGAAVLKRIG